MKQHPYVAVYFERNNSYAELHSLYDTEEDYIKCRAMLVQEAEKNNFTDVTESCEMTQKEFLRLLRCF